MHIIPASPNCYCSHCIKAPGDASRISAGRNLQPKKSKKASAGQKEMLMPIAGKKPAKETPAKKAAAKPQRKSA